MPTSNAEPTAESSDRTIGDWFSFGRRPLLKALGAGGVLGIGSDVAAASGDESDDTSGDEIDPVFGYPTTDAGDIPAALEPAHEVELHRQFPDDLEDPDRPSVFHFEPSGLHVDPGDIVQFTFTDPNHTVTSYHPGHGFQQRVPDGVPAFSSPIVRRDGAWLYRFECEGLYDLYCGPHEIAGMAMRIVVGDIDETDLPEYADTFEAEPPLFPPLSPESLELELNTSDRNDDCEWPWVTDGQLLATDALDPMNVREAGEVSFAAIADELDLAFEPEEDHE